MRGKGAWDAAVNADFIKELIEGIEEMKRESDVTDVRDLKAEVGELAIALIEEKLQAI